MHSASAAGSFHVVESPLPFQSATNNSAGMHPSSSPLQKNSHTNALNPNALPFQCSAFTAAPIESASASHVSSSSATTASTPASVAVHSSMDSVFSKNASQPILWTSPATTAAPSTTTPSSAPMMMMAPVTSGVEGVDGGGRRALHPAPPGTYAMPASFLTSSSAYASPHPVAAQAAYSLSPSGAPMMMTMQPMLSGTGGTMTVDGGRQGREVYMMSSPPSSMVPPHASAGMPQGSFLPMSNAQPNSPHRDGGGSSSVFLYPSPTPTSSPSSPPHASPSVFSQIGSTPLPLGSPQMMWVGAGGGAPQWTMGNQTRVDGNRYMSQAVAPTQFLYPPPQPQQQQQQQQQPSSSSPSAPPPGMMMVPSNTPGMVMMMMMPTRDGVAPTTSFSPPSSNSSFSLVSSPYPSFSAPQATPLPFSEDPSAGVPLSAAYGGPPPSSFPPPPPPPPSSQAPMYSSMEEIRMLHQLPYRAKMLPPPLSMKTHQIVWEKNGHHHDVAATGDRKEAVVFSLDHRENEAVERKGTATEEEEGGGGQGKALPPPHHTTAGIHHDPLGPHLHLSREESKDEIDGERSASKTTTAATIAHPPQGDEKEKSHPSKSSSEGHKEEHQECSAEESSTISSDTTASLSPIRTTGEEGLENSVTEAVSDVPPQETTPSPPSSTVDGEGSSTNAKSERRHSSDFAVSPHPTMSSKSESIEGKWLRLRAYKEILERWFRHIQILQEKPEVIRMSIGGADHPGTVHPPLPTRNPNSCKSYEEILQRHLQSVHATRAMPQDAACGATATTPSTEAGSEGSGEEHADTTTPGDKPLPVLSVDEEEEVLQWWSDECVKWWHETQKKKTRRARKNKRPDDFSGAVGGSRNDGGAVGSTTASAKGRDGDGAVDVAPLPIVSEERSEAILAMQETSGKSAPPSFVATSLEKEGDFSSFGGFFSATGGISLVPPERYDGMGDEAVPRYATSSMSRSSSEIQFEDDSYSHWELTEAMTSDLLREFED